MPEPTIFDLLGIGDPDANEQARYLAQQIRTDRKHAALAGLAGKYGAGMAKQLGAQANEDAALLSKAGSTRLQYGAETQERNNALAQTLKALEAERALGAAQIGADARKYAADRQLEGRLAALAAGANKPAAGKTLTAKEVNDMTEANAMVGNLTDMVDSFKDEFAGTGWKGEVPVMFEHALGGGDRSNWWANYKQKIENIQRHRLFGSAFTASEKKAWEASRRIRPASDPKVVKQAMTDLRDAMARHLVKHAEGRVAEGYNPSIVEHYADEASKVVKKPDVNELKKKYGLE